MNAKAILDRLQSLGITVTAAEDTIRLEPGSWVPPELVDELKAQKENIILLLRGYRLRYPGDQASNKELKEIASIVNREGYVLLWSHTLEDLIAFYKSEEDRQRIPAGFVPYSKAELWQLFGKKKLPFSENSLRLIHEVKKQGGHIVSYEIKDTGSKRKHA